MQERRVRSLAKGLSWRALGTLDTLLLSLIFTGSVTAALSIGGIELVTKVAWYYGHERLWAALGRLRPDHPFARLFGGNEHLRSVVKALTWRAIGALDTFLIALVITGRTATSISIGGTELITKTSLYYLHERLWNHIPWGVETPEELSREHDSPLGDALAVLRYYYHLGAAAFYTVAALAFVIASAAIIYGLHTGL